MSKKYVKKTNRIYKKHEKKLKWEKEYEALSKAFKLGKKEFYNFYKDIRKANRKTQNARYRSHSVYKNKLSYKAYLSYQDRSQFLKGRAKVKEILQPKFREREIIDSRKMFIKNLKQYFGDDAKKVVKRLRSLTPNQFIEFKKKNKELQELFYYFDSEEKLLEIINESIDSLNDRLDDIELPF